MTQEMEREKARKAQEIQEQMERLRQKVNEEKLQKELLQKQKDELLQKEKQEAQRLQRERETKNRVIYQNPLKQEEPLRKRKVEEDLTNDNFLKIKQTYDRDEAIKNFDTVSPFLPKQENLIQ